jgi:hypothetical protein
MLLLSVDVGIKNLSFCLFKLTNNEISIVQWNNIDLSTYEAMKCMEIDKNGICNKSCKYYIQENNQIKCYCLKHSKKKDYLLPQNDLKETFIKKQKINELIDICNKYKLTYNSEYKKNDLINLLVQYSKNNCFIEVKKNNASKVDLVTIGKNIQHKFDNELNDYVSLIDKIIIENQIGPIANKMKTIQGMISQYFIMKNNNISIEFISATNKLKDFINIPKVFETNESNIYEKKKISYKERKKLGIEITTSFLNDDIRFSQWTELFVTSSKKDDLSDCFLQGLWYIQHKITNK